MCSLILSALHFQRDLTEPWCGSQLCAGTGRELNSGSCQRTQEHRTSRNRTVSHIWSDPKRSRTSVQIIGILRRIMGGQGKGTWGTVTRTGQESRTGMLWKLSDRTSGFKGAIRSAVFSTGVVQLKLFEDPAGHQLEDELREMKLWIFQLNVCSSVSIVCFSSHWSSYYVLDRGNINFRTFQRMHSFSQSF